MRNSLFTNIFNPIIQRVGQGDKSSQAAAQGEILDFKPPQRRSRQAAIRTASLLIDSLESGDYLSAVNELYCMHAEDRVFVAETMLWINRQHRSIVTSLPRFNCSYILQEGKRCDLACVEVTIPSDNGCPTSNTFSFKTSVSSVASGSRPRA